MADGISDHWDASVQYRRRSTVQVAIADVGNGIVSLWVGAIVPTGSRRHKFGRTAELLELKDGVQSVPL